MALDACESLSKKSKDENLKISDILKPARSEANVAEEAVSRAENSNQADALLDKEEELQFALKEIERVKINEVVANDNLMKLKKLLSEVEVAMEEEKHKSLSRQESMLKEVEVKVLRVLITEVETFEFGEVDVAEGENVVLENSCASLVGICLVITYRAISLFCMLLRSFSGHKGSHFQPHNGYSSGLFSMFQRTFHVQWRTAAGASQEKHLCGLSCSKYTDASCEY